MSLQTERSTPQGSNASHRLVDAEGERPLEGANSQQQIGDGTKAIQQDIAATKSPRLFFMDNLRVFLTILVIMHHLAITYGAAGSWYYYDPTKNLLTEALLTILTATDQAFFMGLFFLISAYFTPGSYDRKKTGPFLRDKLLRLGFPLLIYGALIDPLVNFIATGSHMMYWHFYTSYMLYMFSLGKGLGRGPSWFIETLLIFVIIYVFWRVWRARRQSRLSQTAPVCRTPVLLPRPTYGSMLLYLVSLALVNFFLRIWFPIGWSFQPLNFQIAFFPQYISMFVLGLLAYRSNWLTRIPDSMGRIWGWVAIIGIVLFPILVIEGVTRHQIQYFEGGLHWQAFVFDGWEATMCVALCTSLLVLFRKHLNRQGRCGRFLSANAYTVYLLFPLVIVALAYNLQAVTLFPLLKYGLAVIIAIPSCFALSALVRMLPYAKRIL